jgi:hypothetical protein
MGRPKSNKADEPQIDVRQTEVSVRDVTEKKDVSVVAEGGAGAERGIGLYRDVAIVDRQKFDELLITILHGYTDRFSAHSLPSHVMKLFHVGTRDEAVKILQKIQADNKERKTDAQST